MGETTEHAKSAPSIPDETTVFVGFNPRVRPGAVGDKPTTAADELDTMAIALAAAYQDIPFEEEKANRGAPEWVEDWRRVAGMVLAEGGEIARLGVQIEHLSKERTELRNTKVDLQAELASARNMIFHLNAQREELLRTNEIAGASAKLYRDKIALLETELELAKTEKNARLGKTRDDALLAAFDHIVDFMATLTTDAAAPPPNPAPNPFAEPSDDRRMMGGRFW